MAPQRTRLSAREAAAELGFASANPILSAIRSGELAAEKLPGKTRNGRNSGAYQIEREALDAYAAARGIVKNGAAAEPEPTEPLSNVVGFVAPPTLLAAPPAPAGEPMVTVPLALILDLQTRVARAEAHLAWFRDVDESQRTMSNTFRADLDSLSARLIKHIQIEGRGSKVSAVSQTEPVEKPSRRRRV